MLQLSNLDSIKDYLVKKELWGDKNDIIAEPLSGGVSNSVIKVTLPVGQFVLKQAQPKLKVEEDWFSDVRRGITEKNCLKLLNKIIPNYVPELLFEDDENFIFIMECAPNEAVTWKNNLMKGYFNFPASKSIAQALSTIHKQTHNRDDVAQMFGSKQFFIELRILPYFEHIREKHIHLRKDINDNIERCLATNLALVTADYSPKNILIDKDKLYLIDFEGAHYGDPSFDLAFLTNHLLLKSIKNKVYQATYLNMVKVMVEEYFANLGIFDRAELEANAVTNLAFLLLARVDGKSPVEYITEESDKKTIRQISYEIVSSHLKTYNDVINLVERNV